MRSRVRERQRRLAERERLLEAARRPPRLCTCASCEAAGRPKLVEDTWKILYECQLSDVLCADFPILFTPPWMEVARFSAACRVRGRRAAGLPP